jgi:ribosomal protein S18 acetylase RimI-like enzyme
LTKIETLDIDEFDHYQIDVEYITKAYQDVKIKKKKNSIIIELKRKRMKRAIKKYQIKLFEDYIEQPIAYGIYDKKHLIACIEGEYVDWNNTFRIWEIYVHPKYRKKGIGAKLFKHMERHVLDINARAITLEVQSCNDPAISFYEKMGMHFIGINTLGYSNYDVQNKEVKLEYGKRMH